MRPNPEATSFEGVVQGELDDISTRRTARNHGPIGPEPDWKRRADDAALSGVCISGGGIRSASFGLGVLQGLTEKGILQQADYVSTVSGGGYTGSWLQGILDRSKSFDTLDPRKPEQPGLHFLRKYSNYLAPRPGMSLDSIVIPVIWTRNAGLNQTIIIAATFAAIIAALLLGHLVPAAMGDQPAWGYAIAFLLTLFAVYSVSRNLKDVVRSEFSGPDTEDTGDPPGAVGYRVVIPLLIAAWSLAIAFSGAASALVWPVLPTMIFLHAALQYFGGFSKCYIAEHPRRKFVALRAGWHVVWMSVVCGALDFGVLSAVASLVQSWKTLGTQGVYQTVAWGPPLLLITLFIGTGLQIGLMGRDFPDSTREWLARAGSWIVLCAFGWAAAFTVGAFAPYWIILLWAWKKASILSAASAWAGSTAAGILAGKSASTGKTPDKEKNNISLDVLARYVPLIALPGFFIAVAFAVHAVLHGIDLAIANPLTWSALVESMQHHYWAVMAFEHLWPIAALLAAAVVVFLVMSVRVNINEFSMHYFYKNRLVRCYLGASAGEGAGTGPGRRMPNRFTGFDPKDDIELSTLVSTADAPRRAPYPILNATLTVTQGSELATQERKAKSWIFAPRFSGFTPEGSEADSQASDEVSPHAYVDTKKLLGGSLHIGTAMAISGAALNPGQGYHTSTQVAFLMTLFDVRLGWWIGNPRDHKNWKRPGPKIALFPLIRELFGSMDERSPYLNLADGGNFENLGLYELVRRRCRYIVAIDGEEDSEFEFSALGGAVRKCRIDFGTEIDIHPGLIRPKGDFSAVHCAFGTITYQDSDEPGYLLYVKASVTGDEPEDVEQYRRDFPVFPQQPTADQFFGEAQFESYRCLGLHCAEKALEGTPNAGLGELFAALRTKWPPGAAGGR